MIQCYKEGCRWRKRERARCQDLPLFFHLLFQRQTEEPVLDWNASLFWKATLLSFDISSTLQAVPPALPPMMTHRVKQPVHPPPPPIGHQVTLKTEYRLRFDGVWLDGENSLCTCMKAEHTIKPELYYYKTESPVCYRKNYKMPSHHRFLPVRVRACKKNISKDSHHQFALPDLWLISRTDSGELWQRCNGLCLPVAGRQPRNTWLNKAGRVW